jgi:hypothetical protein
MSNDDRLMTFEEFRTNREDVVQQQNEFFRDHDATEEVLRPGGLGVSDWTPWSVSGTKVTA